MAQHVSLLSNNLYPDVKEKILKRFSKKNIGLASLKYEELKDNSYKILETDRVFLNSRKINGKQEIFEIHFDTKKKELIEIFWIK